MDNQEQNGLGMNPVNQEPVMDNNSVPTETPQPVEAPVEMPAPAEPTQAPVAEPTPVESTPAPVESAPVTQATEPVAPTSDVTPQVSTPVDTTTPPVKGDGDKGNKVFIGIVVALVLIIAVLAVVILTKGGKSGSGTTTTTTTEETFTKNSTTTDVNVNSTTKQTYNNPNGYTTSTRVTKSDSDPQPVKQNSSILKVDNYEYNLTGGDMVVYTSQGQDFIYDTVDDAEIIVDIFNGSSTNDVIPHLQELADKRYEEGYNVVEGNYGTLNGVSVCYLLLQDNQFLYYEFYLDTGYGDLARYIFLAKKQFTLDSVAKLLYSLNNVAVKKNAGTASAGIVGSLPTSYFDERLLSE